MKKEPLRKQITLRLTKSLESAIERAAFENGIPLTSQIRMMLIQSLKCLKPAKKS